ncbi:CHAT domain-containing protein [Variovorax sp. J22R133]|uniref:CHAT domain-containing protein n=1 Tax=Variovorax brevis TaxID=3053503 RepID=UPI002576A04B|nr:CHAT domain-containing protein [Variovorax sp. J22R133]MDM0117224.1 CHAT domain-containing protein [Variovorax sp. J22R133]
MKARAFLLLLPACLVVIGATAWAQMRPPQGITFPGMADQCAQIAALAKAVPNANVDALMQSAGCAAPDAPAQQVSPSSTVPAAATPAPSAQARMRSSTQEMCRNMNQALRQATGVDGGGFWLGPLPVVIARERELRCTDSTSTDPPWMQALQEGLLRFDKGRFDRSADAFREGLSTAPSDDVRMRLLAEMGKSLLAAGRTDDARAAFDQAFAIIGKVAPPSVPKPQVLQPPTKPGFALFGGGGVDIQAMMERAQRDQEDSMAAYTHLRVQSELLVLKGLAQLQANDVNAAIESLRQANTIAQSQGEGAGMERSIVPPYLALALQRAGRLDEARTLLEGAVAEREEVVGIMGAYPQISESMKTLGMGALMAGQERNVAAGAMTTGETFLPSFACPLLEQVNAQANAPERALEAAEQCRARALAQVLANRAFYKPAPSLDQITSTATRRRDAPSAAELRTELFDNPQAVAASKPATIADMRRMAAERRATVVAYSITTTVNKLPSRMPDRETGVRLWVVSPDGRVTMRERAFAGVLDNADDTYALTDTVMHARRVFGVAGRGPVAVVAARPSPPPPPTQRVTRSSNELRRLHQVLIDPVADLLPAEAGARVLFMPQGALFLVPFAALEDASGAPLIARYSVSITPSMQTLALTGIRKRTSRANGPALIVGNPVMPQYTPVPGQPALDIPDLPGAEEEAKAIGELLKSPPLTGAAATKAEVIRDARNARYIHLATHGFLDDFTEQAQRKSNPNVRSMTMLGGDASNESKTPGMLALAPSGADSGMLTADEIAEVTTNAELVVMSACDSGRGAINDEGVIGLSRAWIAAGAPSVIVSLWAIPDEPTRDLMVSFYGRLQAGAGKSEALRDAMMATRKTYPKTAFWAAFVLMGEPD